MPISRRNLATLLPLLAQAQNAAPLKSTTWRFEDLPVKQNKTSRTRAVFNGSTSRGTGIELHMTEIPAGEAPHGSHQHLHEELVFVLEGTVEVDIEGRKSRIGPGSVAYIGSGEEHGLLNVGSTPARYYLFTMGREKA
ncbi:MAG: cupin domain-containing protein [Acidobacteria bacterium]|nr:cupin domain-containing protein [Acidobacteriota bacterium]